MDKIIINNLEVFAHHGVFEEETRLGQKFLVSATLYVNTRQAGIKDDLKLSVNYGEVCSFIDEFMRDNTYKLIEAAAENLASAILLRFDRIKGIRLEIKKPWAPIGLPIETVSIVIERRWHKVYVAIGSNMGDSEHILIEAVDELNKDHYINVKKISELIKTKPYGYTQQDDFINGAVEIATLYAPHELLDKLHEIENAAGRVRSIHWGPRTLDLDIVMYDDIIYDTDDLIIPHYDMQNRDFVLKPMAELAPNLRHPVLNKTIQQLLNELGDSKR